MTFIELPKEKWTVAINPLQVVMVSPLTDWRRSDPRQFSILAPDENKTVLALCSPLEDGAFWLTVDMPYQQTLELLRSAA